MTDQAEQELRKKFDEIMEDLALGHNFDYAGKELWNLIAQAHKGCTPVARVVQDPEPKNIIFPDEAKFPSDARLYTQVELDKAVAEAHKGYEQLGHKFVAGHYRGDGVAMCGMCVQPESAHQRLYTQADIDRALKQNTIEIEERTAGELASALAHNEQNENKAIVDFIQNKLLVKRYRDRHGNENYTISKKDLDRQIAQLTPPNNTKPEEGMPGERKPDDE